ncbi:hypothetical protein FRC01_009157, partial [Tulasnella sp. 417]
MTLNKGERARVARRLADAITCIPTDNHDQLTEETVYSQLKIQPVSVIHDEHTGWTWLVAEGNEASLLKSRLQTTPLKGYITRGVEDHEEERKRLEQKLEDEIKSRKLQEAASNLLVQGTTSSLQAPEQTQTHAFGEASGSSSSSTPAPCSEGGTPATSTDLGTDNLQSLNASPKLVRPPQKKQRVEVLPLSSSPAPGSTGPTPPSPFDILPVEIIITILRLCLDRMESMTDRLRTLHTLYCVGGPFRRVLSGLPFLWTTIHPALTAHFTTIAMTLSEEYPLSIV